MPKDAGVLYDMKLLDTAPIYPRVAGLLTLFKTYHFTKSRVAIESSTEEWPLEPSPV